MSQLTHPGKVYRHFLVCGLCDYSLQIDHQGPSYDVGRFSLDIRLCPECNKRGIKSFMERSLK
jgi:hypothetical protein